MSELKPMTPLHTPLISMSEEQKQTPEETKPKEGLDALVEKKR